MFELKPYRSAVAASVLLAVALSAPAGEPKISDPTRAPATDVRQVVARAAEPRRLQSTHVSDETQSAVVDGRIVTIGSMLDGAEVVAITAGRVELRRGGESVVLEMSVPTVKRRAGTGDTR